jgi:hypothetical protein
MSFLSRIDWFNHDGVNLGMINDFMRNQFYDRILSRYVANQRCTDIGFGTGLLSMLALKHGAEHVQAFESDLDRYQLGCEIIKQLKLQDRIELINERYDHNYNPRSVTFTETVNGNLWWEGLWNSLPRGHETVFLPGTYFLEMWAVEIPESFARGLCRPGQSQSCFNPGVDVDFKFVSVVNSLAGKAGPGSLLLNTGIVTFERQQETDWGWIPYMRAVQAGSVVASYSATQWDEDRESFTLDVDTKDWRDKTVLIVPRLGMAQDNDRLYLDTGHWGPGENPIILSNPQTNLVVEHSVKTGLITYSLEQLKC